MNNLKKQFGARLKIIRKRKHLTQENLAELISMDTPNLCKMENGKHFPQAKNIERLAEVLNVKIKEFFDFDDDFNEKILRDKIIDYIDNLNKKELEFVYKILTSFLEYKTK